MRNLMLLISMWMLLTSCEFEASLEEQNKTDKASDQNEKESQYKDTENNNDEQNINENNYREDEEKQFDEIGLYNFDNQQQFFVSVEELIDVLGGSYEYNNIDKSLSMSISGHTFYLVYEVPVLEIDGLYKDTDLVSVEEDKEGNAYVTAAFIEKGLEMDYEIDEAKSLISFSWTDEVVQAWSPSGQEKLDIHSFSSDEMIDYLSFLESPIEGAAVSTVESHLPGALRAYRNGTHEGIDWYDYTSTTDITTDTPIKAMAKGVVVRVDHNFKDYPSHEIRDKDLDITTREGFTPDYIFDRLRGMQVWVQYEHGVMNRFAHLDSIPDDLKIGQEVTEDTIIGFVGNSGTSGALNQDGSGLHLHQDLLIYGELFWEPFTLDETAQILQELWQ